MPTVSFQQGTGYSGTVDVTLRELKPKAAPSEALGLFIDGDSGAQVQTLLAFTALFGTGPGQIPIGATITSATLTLRVTDATTTGVSLSRMLIDWPEQSSWNSLGNGVQLNGVEAAAAADLVVTNLSTGFRQFDVTASLQTWLGGATTAADANDANNGWVFSALGTDLFAFRSSESGAVPVLTVTYTVDGQQEPPSGDVIGVRVHDASEFGPGHGSTDPTDVAYDPATGSFYVTDSEVDESPFNSQNNLFKLDGDADPLQAYSLRSFSSEVTGVAVWQDRLYFSDDNKKMIYVVDKDNPSVLLSGQSFSTTLFGIGDPEDLSINPNNGNLFILNEYKKTIYEIAFTGNGPQVVDEIVLPSPFTTNSNGAEGIVYDAENDQFYACAGRSSTIYVVSRDGVVTDTIDVLAQYPNDGGYRVFPKGLELAPSSTDPTKLSLWVTDYGRDQVADGRLFEIMLDRPAQQSGSTTTTAFASFESETTTQATSSDTFTPGEQALLHREHLDHQSSWDDHDLSGTYLL